MSVRSPNVGHIMTKTATPTSAEPFGTLTSTIVVLPYDDIDTDQIIPARFLTTTERSGLGAYLFADWRAGGERPSRGAPLDEDRARGAQILVAGRNFGCGSSREHAPWALLDYGFRAVIAPSFADIFRENALKNALLPVAVTEDEHAALLRALANDPGLFVTVDLATQTVSVPGALRASFPIAPFAKRCLSLGVDQLGYVLDADAEITAYELSHAAPVRTVS
jgi:3-isopropylmalate/(R)-2-methylmalate dehydratase small subunit